MKFLICSDGSEQAERAVRLGAMLAAGCDVQVTLLGIIETPGQSDAILDSLRRGHALLQDKKIPTELVTKSGSALAEIKLHTQAGHFDLVIIGAVRKAVDGLFWMSSKAYKIVKQSRPPVLLVIGPHTSVKRVLVCSGGRRYIDQAIQLTGQLLRCAGATATLLHVMPLLPAIYANWPRIEENTDHILKSQSELGINLRREQETLASFGVPTEVRLRRGSVLEELLAEIRSGNYDLVVTGSGLSRGLRTYVLGDISREIVNRADCPVLVVRSQEQPSEAGWPFRGWWRQSIAS